MSPRKSHRQGPAGLGTPWQGDAEPCALLGHPQLVVFPSLGLEPPRDSDKHNGHCSKADAKSYVLLERGYNFQGLTEPLELTDGAG